MNITSNWKIIGWKLSKTEQKISFSKVHPWGLFSKILSSIRMEFCIKVYPGLGSVT